jgi:hypothetical protein
VPQEDDKATKLKHGKEIGLVISRAGDEAAEVMEPGKETFDLPAAAVTARFADKWNLRDA